MSRLFRVLLAMFAYGVVSGHCLNAKAETTTVTFQSSTYSDMRQILAREAPTGTVTITGRLGFPDQTKERHPAVIVVHTIGGYRDANEGYVAAELQKAGFATLMHGCQGTAKSLYLSSKCSKSVTQGDQPDAQHCDADCIGRD